MRDPLVLCLKELSVCCASDSQPAPSVIIDMWSIHNGCTTAELQLPGVETMPDPDTPESDPQLQYWLHAYPPIVHMWGGGK